MIPQPGIVYQIKDKIKFLHSINTFKINEQSGKNREMLLALFQLKCRQPLSLQR